MIYRVDYVIGVMLAGLVVGLLLSRRTSSIEAARLARWYFVIIAVRLALGAVVFACSVVLVNASTWNTISTALGDASNFLLGVLLGVALLRADRREVLSDPSVYSALCLAMGIGFVMSGFGKAFYMEGFIQFFTQSGYSLPFLKFIMTAEVLGGAALLIPITVLPAVVGLSMDMFGAIYTHIHNGDPLNDSTGAIGALIRFGILICLWAWRPRPSDAPGSVRRRLMAAGAVGVCCAIAAVGGSEIVRHTVRQQASPHAMASSNRGHWAYEQTIVAENEESSVQFDAPTGRKT